ncbi:MAG: M48 family metallopeptidase [Chitinispirillia bacterium]|nr:M48 family metallopeptidase [Chitinispirillia bacterium]
MKPIPYHLCILAMALASFVSAENPGAGPMRIGILEAEMYLYNVSAGGIFEYRDDWSAKASRQASIAAALTLVKAGHSPIILPDIDRSRPLFRLKTRMRYHGTAFQSPFFSGIGERDTLTFSVGSLDSLCDRFNVDGFLYIYGSEEKFSPERRQILMAMNGAEPQERSFMAYMLADRSGRILWYDQIVSEPSAVPADTAYESVHTESLLAQSKGMERRFRNQNLFWDDRDLEEYLDEILDKLVKQEERAKYNFRVRILRSSSVNAFAAPDGGIYVCMGLLARVINEAQAAAILAHEIGHVVKDHTARNLMMMKEYARTEALSALTQDAKAKPARRGRKGRGVRLSTDSMFETMSGFLRAAIDGYRQELEDEADSVAVARMAAAGDPPIKNFRQFVANMVDIDNLALVPDDIIERGYFNIKFRSVALNDAVENYSAGRHGWTELQSDRLLSIDECDPSALIIRGDMERFLAPRSTAWAEWYERALTCDQNDLAVLRAAGFAYFAIGDKAKAREYLSRYCELAKDAPDIKMAKEILRQCE